MPTNTGATVAHPRGNLTAAVILATTRAHEENIQIWKEYTNVMRAAKQVIFNHVLDTCYLSLKKKYTGYVNNMYLEIYNNLIEEYEEFSDDEMQENDMLMKKEKTGEKRFEDSLQKIEDCVKNVASQNPYTPAQKVLIGFKNIDKCGFYSDDCRTGEENPIWEKPCLPLKFTL